MEIKQINILKNNKNGIKKLKKIEKRKLPQKCPYNLAKNEVLRQMENILKYPIKFILVMYKK